MKSPPECRPPLGPRTAASRDLGQETAGNAREDRQDDAVWSRREATIHRSPRQAAQRQRIDRNFRPPLQRKGNATGIPDDVKSKMEKVFDTDFSAVRIHAGSARSKAVGALAYTQGHDIHFAPGQYQPGTGKGKQLLGHELTHVVQQRDGRVKPTGEINGMPLNDNAVLEEEADAMGSKAR